MLQRVAWIRLSDVLPQLVYLIQDPRSIWQRTRKPITLTFSVDLPFADEIALVGDHDDGGTLIFFPADVLEYLYSVLE